MALPMVLALASLALSSGGEVAGHIAQNKAASKNRQEALRAFRLQAADIAARRDEETQATGLDLSNARTLSLVEQGMSTVSAAENGVTGASVAGISNTLARGLLDYKTTAMANLRMTNSALDRQYQSAEAQRDSRINSVSKASPLATGIRLAGHGISAASQIHKIKQPLK
jgi:hypothetical protein